MIDILRLCRDLRIPTAEAGEHHHAHTGWVQLHCPFCSGGREGFHLGFSLGSGALSCWRCGKHTVGETLRALARTHDTRELIRKYELHRPFSPKEKAEREEKDAPPPPGLGPMLPVHRRYLRRRNFDPDALEREWGLQGTAGLSGIWSWRVVFPIYSETERIVAYQGRTISPTAKPRYRMTADKEMTEDPNAVLYGIHRARGNSVLVVEGATGVWRLGPGCVATLGMKWRKKQAERLRQYNNRFILFDPEPEAQQKAKELAELLSLFPGTTEVVSGFRTDPGDFSDALAERIMRRLGIL
jgi:hypothetical protein